MKDFHVCAAAEAAGLPVPFSPPRTLGSDWLNQWWDARSAAGACRKDDYRFLYLGKSQSFTPMHHDVVRSNSWSVNLVGVKLWLLFHPAHTAALTSAAPASALVPDGRWLPGGVPDAAVRAVMAATGMRADGATALLTCSLDAKDVTARWPALASVPRHVVLQQPGEVMFVPSGWHHQVHNVAARGGVVMRCV